MKIYPNMMTLYAVTDSAWTKKQTLMEQVKDALEGGITFLQLREKNLDEEAFLNEAIEMSALAKKYQVPFVINDNIEIAIKSNADGVHVGQDDMEVSEVRKLLGKDKVIGVSTHTVEEAIRAEEGGADYLGVGAVYSTDTKTDANVVPLDEIKRICDAVSIPVVAIGGIKKDNIHQLYGSHVDGVAVVSAIFASEHIKEETKELLSLAKQL